MEGGAVFREVLTALQSAATETAVWTLSAEDYGVPQRRKRIVIVGFRRIRPFTPLPGPLTGGLLGEDPITVREALDDLPRLAAGEDGTAHSYETHSITDYQRLMRGEITASTFVARLSEPRIVPTVSSRPSSHRVLTRRGKPLSDSTRRTPFR
jgi:DNA (cytosine-5)-methyltransferase 1